MVLKLKGWKKQNFALETYSPYQQESVLKTIKKLVEIDVQILVSFLSILSGKS